MFKIEHISNPSTFIYFCVCYLYHVLGKDSVANLLHEIFIERYGDFMLCKRNAIASTLKLKYAKLHNIDPKMLFDDQHREFKEQHRSGLVEMGRNDKLQHGQDVYINELITAVAEEYKDDLYYKEDYSPKQDSSEKEKQQEEINSEKEINNLQEKQEEDKDESQLQERIIVQILSDVRYKVEREAPKKHNNEAFTIRVNATDETRKQRGWKFVPEIDLDASECELDNEPNFDLILDNDGTLEELRNKLLQWMGRKKEQPSVNENK